MVIWVFVIKFSLTCKAPVLLALCASHFSAPLISDAWDCAVRALFHVLSCSPFEELLSTFVYCPTSTQVPALTTLEADFLATFTYNSLVTPAASWFLDGLAAIWLGAPFEPFVQLHFNPMTEFHELHSIVSRAKLVNMFQIVLLDTFGLHAWQICYLALLNLVRQVSCMTLFAKCVSTLECKELTAWRLIVAAVTCLLLFIS
jgi:hypothetical protein